MSALVAAILTMSAAQLLDLATFALMVGAAGPEVEANPLVGALFGAYGLPMVAVAKVALVSLVTAVVVILVGRPGRQRLAAVVVAVGILVGLVGGLSNTLVLATTL